MATETVTFDFHNTIAACPEWFELEVRRLPSAFLAWWASADGVAVSPETCEDADLRYRELRREIMAHGNELPAEACLDQVFHRLGLDVPADVLATGVEMLMRETLDYTSPIPGAVETVQALHRNGVRLGVVSSAVYHPFLEWTLERFGIRGHFQNVVTSASAGFYKSRPEIYHTAARLLGAAPRQMVHVGDSLRFDVGGAARAGMGTVWLRHSSATHDDTIIPDLTLETLEASAAQIQEVVARRANSAHGEHS